MRAGCWGSIKLDDPSLNEDVLSHVSTIIVMIRNVGFLLQVCQWFS